MSNTVRRIKPAPENLSRNTTTRSGYHRYRYDPRIQHRFQSGPNLIVDEIPASFRVNLGFGADPDVPNVDGALRLRIKDQTGNLLQDMAEFRQTRDLLTSGCRDALRAFHSLRSGRAPSEFIRILRRPRSENELAIANRWLQYQYGVRPLIGSIYDYTDALARRVRTGMTLYVRASRKSVRESRTTGSYGYASHYNEISVRKVASYQVSYAALKQLSQLGITNPAAVAWELIPYSFVIDQFINVGDFLDSLDALLGVQNLVVTGVLRGHKRTEQTFTSQISGPTGWYEEFNFARYAQTNSLALPRISFSLPGGNLGSRLASMLGLLRQLRR